MTTFRKLPKNKPSATAITVTKGPGRSASVSTRPGSSTQPARPANPSPGCGDAGPRIRENGSVGGLSSLLEPEIFADGDDHLAVKNQVRFALHFGLLVDAVRPEVLRVGVQLGVERLRQLGVDGVQLGSGARAREQAIGEERGPVGGLS